MDMVRLGRTGLMVSAAGLGTGGHSRLGLGQGKGFENAVAVIRRALDLGVTLIDTSSFYGTEEAVGAAIVGRRDQVVISTKNLMVRAKTSLTGADYLTPTEFKAAVEANLARLGTDYIDMLHVHGVCEHQYSYCESELVPVLKALRDEGKIRFLAISERFNVEPSHAMLQKALADECWDVVMVGFNIINQSALQTVLPKCVEKDVGTLCIYAVRSHLSSLERAQALVTEAVAAGEIDPAALDAGDALAFLLTDGGASSLTNACYRFSRHAPGAHVVLTGTGEVAHLEQNLRSINDPALPAPILEKLHRLFGRVTTVSGD